MKKIWILAILVLLLAGLVTFFIVNKGGSTLKKELRDFAIEDTSVVTKVFLADKNNHTIVLERKDGYWALNEKYYARPDLINLLLKTLYRLNVKSPVSKGSFDNMVKNLSAKSTKVEVYCNDKKTKVFYVGGATMDNQGTYMLLEGSSVPFIIDIPGFNGYLTTRFTTDLNDWRDKTAFHYKLSDISSISLQNPSAPSQSFIVKHNADKSFSLLTYDSQKALTGYDSSKVKEYMAYFKHLNFESYVTEITKERRDSILKSRPMLILTVTGVDGQKKGFRLYRRPNYGKLLDDNGKVFEFDTDRMYGYLENEKELVIAQYYVFDPVMKELNQFFSTKDQKNRKL